MNGMMVIAVAFVLPLLDFSAVAAKRLGWIIVADGWGNVGFYFFGNFSGNRGLSFGDSRLGEGDIFSALALGPAYFFGALALIALAIIGHRALTPALTHPEPGLNPWRHAAPARRHGRLRDASTTSDAPDRSRRAPAMRPPRPAGPFDLHEDGEST